jgi:hypothetical protein
MTQHNLLFPFVFRFGTPIFARLFCRRYRRETMSSATGRPPMVDTGAVYIGHICHTAGVGWGRPLMLNG